MGDTAYPPEATALRDHGLRARREGDSSAAERYFREAFEKGHPLAGHDLAALLLDRGDRAAAEEWYRRAAERGVPESAFEVGYAAETRGQLAEAEQWYRRAADGEHVGGLLNLGSLLRRRGEPEEAKRHWLRAWETSSSDKAAFNIGLLLDDDGKGDLAAAAEWYGRAADAGNAGAAHNLGFVWQDRGEPARGLAAWQQAADLGHPRAAYAVADVHLARQDVREGAAWLRRAVLEAGDARAARRLGDLYRSTGQPRLARYWSEYADGPTRYSPELQAYASGISAAAIHQQDVFNDSFTMEWVEWDLEATTLTVDGRTLRGLTVLGSFSNVSETWLWAWDNPSYAQDLPSLAALRTIREFGERHGIPEFVRGQSDFSRFAKPAEGAFTMALTAAPLIGARGVCFVTVNDGQGRLVLATDDPSLPTAEFDRLAAPRLLTRAAEVWSDEQHRVVRGFLTHHGFEIEETPAVLAIESADGHRVTVRCPMERAREHPEVAALLDRDDAEVESSPARVRGVRAGGESPERLDVFFDLDDRVVGVSCGHP